VRPPQPHTHAVSSTSGHGRASDACVLRRAEPASRCDARSQTRGSARRCGG
jgi:hypothetical protein